MATPKTTKIEKLRDAKTLDDLARLLGFTPSGLSYVIYKLASPLKYRSFEIPKRKGGKRLINAPQPMLALLQRRLAKFLYDCLVELKKGPLPWRSLAHGFEKKRSIITNATLHKRRRYVLNLDLEDFFLSINFGRVRGFFMKDRHFALQEKVATVTVTGAEDQDLLEYNGATGAPSAVYAVNLGGGLDDVLNRVVPGGPRQTLMPDILGSIIAGLDSGGTLTRIAYQSFGESASAVAAGAGPRYTARRLDPETAIGGGAQPNGLYYYRARMYSPTWGRFLQPDPIGPAGGGNLYAYVRNDPLNLTDPLGLCDNPQGCGVGSSLANFATNAYNAILAQPISDISDLLQHPSEIPGAISSIVPAMVPAAAELPQAVSGVVRAIQGLASLVVSTSPNASQMNVQFGGNENQIYHTFRHIEDLGVERGPVSDAIRADLARQGQIAPGTNITGTVTVNGVTLEYRAFGLPNGTVNVGRITGP